jgi:hypothetical protein
VIRFIPLFVLALWGFRLAARKAQAYALRQRRARIVGADRPGAYD